jgi:hypothetical protein
MRIESKRGRREEKRRENGFYNLEKAYFSSCSSIITPLPLLFNDELKLALPQHFKSLKMEKN